MKTIFRLPLVEFVLIALCLTGGSAIFIKPFYYERYGSEQTFIDDRTGWLLVMVLVAAVVSLVVDFVLRSGARLRWSLLALGALLCAGVKLFSEGPDIGWGLVYQFGAVFVIAGLSTVVRFYVLKLFTIPRGQRR